MDGSMGGWMGGLGGRAVSMIHKGARSDTARAAKVNGCAPTQQDVVDHSGNKRGKPQAAAITTTIYWERI
jgi:hypothetical protein